MPGEQATPAARAAWPAGDADATPAEKAAWLTRNAVDSLPAGGIERKLAEGRPLRVKLGIDPTAPDIHLGHTVVLRKLREFQDLGNIVVLIIGDYTARVGDPSGRSEMRPMLSGEEIDANARTFQEQAFQILDRERIEVRRNGEWLDMRMDELFRLARTTTVAQILERDDFAKRQAARAPISLLELLYPLLQGYDSVEVKADVELGGTDQKFNLLLARDIQRAYGVPEQTILTMPILPGTDGERRMSKSLGNYIGVTEPPAEIYGKTLSIPDAVVPLYYELLLGRPVPEDLPPRDAKRALARDLVAEFHDGEAAQAAEVEFDRVHREGGTPDEVEEVTWPAGELGQSIHLPELLRRAFGVSTSDARRALGQGGVSIEGEPVLAGVLDMPASELDGKVLRLGKRRFARVRVG
ncbi:MAG TPA: tyrosine--tRNA ligase [Solirubrobacteraceae bacterium]|jgi:tyrosyl-tRNA synthetase|nr:tyrosine--tRNA ligase [Solirubrobacteraceae bacterium]